MSVGDPPQSYRATIGIGKESTYDTAVSPSYFIDAVSDGFELDSGNDELDTTRDRQTNKIEAGAFDVSGGWDAPANPEGGFGLVLKALLGSETVNDLTTGESYEHVYTPGNTIPSLTVQINNDQSNVQYTGAWVDQLELTHTSEERLSYSVDTPAATPNPGASSMSPSYSALRNFWFHDASFTIDGSSRAVDLSDLTVTISNNGGKLWRDSRTPNKAELGALDVEYEATLDFESTEAFDAVLGSSGASSVQDSLSPIDFQVTWASPSTIASSSDQFQLQIESPEVQVMTHAANVDTNDLVVEDATIVPRVDQSGTISDMLEVRLRNSVSSSY